ncbi:hypothetical protein X943_000409 [Babesia divergens]|uniref:Uncharacterized protein n=1 Tax=Babesia divergens TaxID=32595 RepID=A0AAD9GL18_BABDI|nr:hypothetical protein X943_000409 [Babesia divergens]
MQFDDAGFDCHPRFESLHTHGMMSTEPYLCKPPITMRHLKAMDDDAAPSNIVWKMNKYFEEFKRLIYANSIYSCLVFFIVAIVFGVGSFTLDCWRHNVIGYSCDKASGSSMTVLGACRLYRVDSIITRNSTALDLSKDLHYSDVASDAYCGAPFEDLRKASSPLEMQLFRTITRIGLLNHEAEETFVKLHGQTIYDVLCSHIAQLAVAGKIVLIMGLFSYVLFTLMSYLVIKRSWFPPSSTFSDISRMVGNIFNVMWIFSIVLGLVGFIAYVGSSEGPACVDETGTPVKCPLYTSAYFFVIYLCSNALCFVSYVLYGRSLALDRAERNQLKF